MILDDFVIVYKRPESSLFPDDLDPNFWDLARLHAS